MPHVSLTVDLIAPRRRLNILSPLVHGCGDAGSEVGVADS